MVLVAAALEYDPAAVMICSIPPCITAGNAGRTTWAVTSCDVTSLPGCWLPSCLGKELIRLMTGCGDWHLTGAVNYILLWRRGKWQGGSFTQVITCREFRPWELWLRGGAWHYNEGWDNTFDWNDLIQCWNIKCDNVQATAVLTCVCLRWDDAASNPCLLVYISDTHIHTWHSDHQHYDADIHHYKFSTLLLRHTTSECNKPTTSS